MEIISDCAVYNGIGLATVESYVEKMNIEATEGMQNSKEGVFKTRILRGVHVSNLVRQRHSLWLHVAHS
jgi:hypothetical protein